MIEIDGSEGGGQLLRTALSLSALTEKPFKITNIRKIRPQPGLKPQHLTAIKATKDLCNAKTKYADLKSTNLEFYPSKVKGGNFKIDIGTAGSTTLVLQTLLPPCLHEESTTKIKIIGGTDTIYCPGSHYFKYVFLNLLKRMNINLNFEIKKYGFYPKGGGILEIEIPQNKDLKELNILEQGPLKEIQVHAVSSKTLEQAKVAERLIKGFKKNYDEEIKTKTLYVDTYSTSCFIHAHAEYQNCIVGSSTLGERGVPAEEIGKKCAETLKFETNGNGLDHNAADQLMIYLALKGKGTIKTSRIGQHVKTNAPIIEKFLPVKFKIEKNTLRCLPD